MNLDINDLRVAVTLLSFVTFVGICWWALSGRRTAAFAEAARLALDDDLPVRTNNTNGASHE
jgi:cytochrome c oxidase cbb3-type subunit 4